MKQLKQFAGQKGEQGQAIVLIALFMVVMLAMVGVAIDGGGLFWLWRNAQNAADTAALQAAYDRCTGATEAEWQAQGYEAALINGFPDNNQAGTDDVLVDLYTHPADSVEYVRVRIEAPKPKYFIQLVYSGPLQVTAQSLVYCSGAVDFSDLPGMVALGGCDDCPPGSADKIDFLGADYRFEGDMHSNCEIGISAGGGGHTGAIEGDVTASQGDPNLHNVVPDGDNPDGEEPVIPPPPIVPPNLYFPGGEIFVGINQDTEPDMAIYLDWDDDDYTTAPPTSAKDTLDGANLQGLYAIDGHVIIDPSSFGPEGLTVVASGTITYKNSVRGSENLAFYGHNSANAPYDEGVTRRWSRGDGSAFLLYSFFSTMPACNAGSSSVIDFPSGGGGDGGDIDLDGMLYAPYGGLSFSGSQITFRGPVIAQRIDGSGSDQHWITMPSYLQPMAPVMNNAE